MATAKKHTKARSGAGLLASLHVERTTVRFEPLSTIFAQGDRCAGVMFLDKGRVQLSVRSPDGRTMALSALPPGVVFGEAALAGQRLRKSTAEAVTACSITIVKTAEMRRRLQGEIALSDWLRGEVLARNIRIQEDLVKVVFNGSDKRLARALLLLAGFDEHQLARHALPIISRELLAEMTGTARATIDKLMRSFRRSGFLERAPDGGLQVHRSLMSVLLQP